MLDDHKDDRRPDDGLSLNLEPKPPSGAAEGQHQPILNSVNDGQRIGVIGVLGLPDRMPPPVIAPVAAANGISKFDPPVAANGMMQQRTFSGGQRSGMNGVLRLTERLPPVSALVVTAPVAAANSIAEFDPPVAANGMVQQRTVNCGQRSILRRMVRLPPVSAPVANAPVNPPPAAVVNSNTEVTAESKPRGRRRPRQEKSVIIPPPYPWSTNRRAKVHALNTLLSEDITSISGDVRCRNCEQKSKLNFNLLENFTRIWNFVLTHSAAMHARAPQKWLFPNFPTCTKCGNENSLKPVIADKKRNINWLFLLLGETVGCCSLEQLKYFCKHTKNHRTGAKNRVLYLTYLTLCDQLNAADSPESPDK